MRCHDVSILSLSEANPPEEVSVPEFYEVVHAKVRPGGEEEMLSRRPVLEAGVREKLPGLLDIRLVRLDDGTYLDVLRWDSRAAADAAIEKFAEVPEAGEIHAFLAETLAHHRGDVAGD
jgi:heme-degrading monooxygenase HmoA